MKKFFLAIFVIVIILSCNQENTSEQNTDSKLVTDNLQNDFLFGEENKLLFSEIDYPESVFTANSDKDSVFKIESGSEIIVPNNVFVDKNGVDVKGDITIKYKEYHSASDIILNNLDMRYDSAGVTYDFQTAGMFKIEAFKDSKAVFIKEGKELKVNFASDITGDYNFYRYENGNWTYQEPIKAEVIVDKVKSNNNNSLKPVELDTKKDLVIDVKPDYSHIKELKDYSKIIWKYAGNLSKNELKVILSKKVVYPRLERSNIVGVYLYKFKQGKEEKYLKITPVFTGKAYVTAMKKFNSTNPSTVGSGNNIRRSVGITELGLMNYDIISKMSDAIFVNGNFYLKNEGAEAKLIKSPVFHISGQDNIIVKQNNGNRLGYSRSFKNKLVAVLPGNKIAVLNSKDFFNTMTNKRGNQNTDFFLTLIEDVVKNPNDLDKIITEL